MFATFILVPRPGIESGTNRSSGRPQRLVEIDFDTKHPIVLDAGHTIVKLFLWHTHPKNHHQGIDYLRSKVQETYAILKLRYTQRSIKSNCVLYSSKFRAATIQPIMADLPKERHAYQSPPFTNTGVDYFGPFYVTVRRTTEKRWGFLFTCLTTRAVPVEVVPSVDTSSCVMGMDWFVSRRGTHAMIRKMVRTSLERRKSSVNVSKNGIRLTLLPNLHLRTLSGGSIRPVRHTEVVSERGWSVVLRGYCTPSSVHAASQMRCWVLLFVLLNKH